MFEYNVYNNGNFIGMVEADTLRKALEAAQQKYPRSVSRIQVKLSGPSIAPMDDINDGGPDNLAQFSNDNG